jgi:hypothetical protein
MSATTAAAAETIAAGVEARTMPTPRRAIPPRSQRTRRWATVVAAWLMAHECGTDFVALANCMRPAGL